MSRAITALSNGLTYICNWANWVVVINLPAIMRRRSGARRLCGWCRCVVVTRSAWCSHIMMILSGGRQPCTHTNTSTCTCITAVIGAANSGMTISSSLPPEMEKKTRLKGEARHWFHAAFLGRRRFVELESDRKKKQTSATVARSEDGLATVGWRAPSPG